MHGRINAIEMIHLATTVSTLVTCEAARNPRSRGRIAGLPAEATEMLAALTDVEQLRLAHIARVGSEGANRSLRWWRRMMHFLRVNTPPKEEVEEDSPDRALNALAAVAMYLEFATFTVARRHDAEHPLAGIIEEPAQEALAQLNHMECLALAYRLAAHYVGIPPRKDVDWWQSQIRDARQQFILSNPNESQRFGLADALRLAAIR